MANEANHGAVFGKKAVEQLSEVVKRVLREYRYPVPEFGRKNTHQRHLQGKLDGALAVATDFSSGATTATLSVWLKNSSGNMADSGDNVTVVNRSLTLSYVTGQICKVEWIDGEWQIYAADCEA